VLSASAATHRSFKSAGDKGQRGSRVAWMISVTTISVMRSVSCLPGAVLVEFDAHMDDCHAELFSRLARSSDLR